MKKKECIVVSGVNLVEGGTLTIFNNFLTELEENFSPDYRIVALVHKNSMFDFKNIEFIEFPKIKRNWLRRIHFEYFKCLEISKQINPDYWIAMHDMTPRVYCKKIFVYCHNAMCFYKMNLKRILDEPKLYLFSKFYKYLYKINIRKNTFVITQQNWIKKSFEDFFGIQNVIVAYPFEKKINSLPKKTKGNKFIYPALPRFFKNHETLLESWKLAIQKNPNFEGQLKLTMNGNENNYSRKIFKKYAKLKGVEFIGIVSPTEMKKLYSESDCLIFPSYLETWGLPLSEAQEFGLTIIAADLPYARESIGDYESASYFKHFDIEILSEKIIDFSNGDFKAETKAKNQNQNTLKNWNELIKKILY